MISSLCGPSALLLPTSLLQLSLAAIPKEELQIRIHPVWQFRKPWKPCRADKFSALCLLKGYKHTSWSILPPATCVGRAKVFVHVSTRTSVQPLSGCVL